MRQMKMCACEKYAAKILAEENIFMQIYLRNIFDFFCCRNLKEYPVSKQLI